MIAKTKTLSPKGADLFIKIVDRTNRLDLGHAVSTSGHPEITLPRSGRLI
jgi:hypothetical protein